MASSWGGSRTNAGRKVHQLGHYKQRTVRIHMYKEDYIKWKSLLPQFLEIE